MEIGRKIYYDILTGDVVQDTGERRGTVGAVVVTSIEQDIITYKSLSERNRESFDVIELEYGQYQQDFIECNGYRVNPETKELEFSYPDPSDPDAPPVYGKPLTEQIEDLKTQNTELMLAVAELASVSETDKMETQLAIAELATIVMGGVA